MHFPAIAVTFMGDYAPGRPRLSGLTPGCLLPGPEQRRGVMPFLSRCPLSYLLPLRNVMLPEHRRSEII